MVRLERIDDVALERLIALATSEASPDEVMPPVEGPPGWTQSRHDAFRAFYRSRRDGLETACREVMLLIVNDDQIVGSVRLATIDPDTFETGMWLTRSTRGRGIGADVLRAVIAEVTTRGARRLIVETTSGNGGALSILKKCGATFRSPDSDGRVHAHFQLGSSVDNVVE